MITSDENYWYFLIAFRRKISIPYVAYKTLPDLLFHISVSSYFLFLPPADPHSFLTRSSGQFLSHSSSLPHAGLHFLVILPSHFLFLFFSFPLPESLERVHLSPQSLAQSRQCWRCRRMGGVDSGPVIRLPSLSSAPTLPYPTLSVALWGGRAQSMNFCFVSGSLLGAFNNRCRRETASLLWGKGLAPSFLWSSCFCGYTPASFLHPSCCVPVAAAESCEPAVFPTLEKPAEDVFQNPQHQLSKDPSSEVSQLRGAPSF